MKSPISSKPLKQPRLIVRRVVGDSMMPTLADGHIIIAVQPRSIQVGDVVVVRHSGLEKVKRINQITGQKVTALGDNTANSTDSRSFGDLPISAVTAKVIWPRV